MTMLPCEFIFAEDEISILKQITPYVYVTFVLVIYSDIIFKAFSLGNYTLQFYVWFASFSSLQICSYLQVLINMHTLVNLLLFLQWSYPIHKKSIVFVLFFLHCLLEELILIIFLFIHLWPSVPFFFQKSITNVLFFRAVTPFRFSEVFFFTCYFFPFTLMQLLHISSPQRIYPWSFMPEHDPPWFSLSLYKSSADCIGGHDKKFEEAWGCGIGGLTFPLIVGVHYRKCSLRAALIYHLQPCHHIQRDSLFSESALITTILITQEGSSKQRFFL